MQKNKNVSSCNVLQLEKCELTYLYCLQLHQRSSNVLFFSNTEWNKHFFTDTQKELFFKNPKLLGLGRHFGLKCFEAFGVFSAKLSALFWHCESLVHGKKDLVVFPTKFTLKTIQFFLQFETTVTLIDLHFWQIV